MKLTTYINLIWILLPIHDSLLDFDSQIKSQFEN